MEGLKQKIFYHIKHLHKESVIESLRGALEAADSPARKTRVSHAITYIENHWEGIRAAIENPHIPCSAEGHVSHVLSARMSSRTMAWSLEGADRMASMLAVQANKQKVGEHYLSSQSALPVLDISEEVQKQVHKLKSRIRAGKETIGNIPLTQAGMSLTREALQGLKGRRVG